MDNQEIVEMTADTEDVAVMDNRDVEIVNPEDSDYDDSHKISAKEVALGSLAVIGGISVIGWTVRKIKNSKLGKKIAEKVKSKFGKKNDDSDDFDVEIVKRPELHNEGDKIQ